MRTFIVSLSRDTCSTTSLPAEPLAQTRRQNEARLDTGSSRTGDDPVARLEAGLARRSALRQTGNDDRVLDFGDIEAEPRTRRLVPTAVGQEIVE